MPRFKPNYPFADLGEVALLPTPERVGAAAEYTGRGVVIAFIDAGFYMHPDLDDRVLVHADASTNHIVEQPYVETIDDLSWHGQMTSVIACGDGRTSGGRYRGIASGSQLVLVKVSSPRGLIKEHDILRGLRWILDTHRRFNIKIVNISVGGDHVSNDPNHPLHRAIARLVEAGVTVIAAAGNRNAHDVVPPASTPQAITVGGYDDHNSLDRTRWTPYHNDHGPAYDGSYKPDLTAPAMWIASPILPGSFVDREARWLAPLLRITQEDELKPLLERGYADLGLKRNQINKLDDHLYGMLQGRINGHKLVDAQHQHVDGTSVSAAILSSVAAQMLEVNPSLTPAQIRAIFVTTAQQLPAVPSERQGAGMLNARGAVRTAAQKQQII
ncbi:MAG: S8 family serine peptidase [Chloroflexi bacterium]|nr:S8 family serine peptidase [Chloroflexota bacterium]